jgi:hypothetical protein
VLPSQHPARMQSPGSEPLDVPLPAPANGADGTEEKDSGDRGDPDSVWLQTNLCDAKGGE